MSTEQPNADTINTAQRPPVAAPEAIARDEAARTEIKAPETHAMPTADTITINITNTPAKTTGAQAVPTTATVPLVFVGNGAHATGGQKTTDEVLAKPLVVSKSDFEKAERNLALYIRESMQQWGLTALWGEEGKEPDLKLNLVNMVDPEGNNEQLLFDFHGSQIRANRKLLGESVLDMFKAHPILGKLINDDPNAPEYRTIEDSIAANEPHGFVSYDPDNEDGLQAGIGNLTPHNYALLVHALAGLEHAKPNALPKKDKEEINPKIAAIAGLKEPHAHNAVLKDAAITQASAIAAEQLKEPPAKPPAHQLPQPSAAPQADALTKGTIHEGPGEAGNPITTGTVMEPPNQGGKTTTAETEQSAAHAAPHSIPLGSEQLTQQQRASGTADKSATPTIALAHEPAKHVNSTHHIGMLTQQQLAAGAAKAG